jgi:hypothetical protein
MRILHDPHTTMKKKSPLQTVQTIGTTTTQKDIMIVVAKDPSLETSPIRSIEHEMTDLKIEGEGSWQI